MSPTDNKAPIDPRSTMTDRNKFMSRSLHTVRIVAIVAADIAKRQTSVSGPTDAVRRALRFLELPDHYDAETDPTMAKCVETARKLMGK